VVTDDLADDKCQEFLCKVRIQFGIGGKPAKTRYLLYLSFWIRRRQTVFCLQQTYTLGTPKSLRQHIRNCGIYVVDTLTYLSEFSQDAIAGTIHMAPFIRNHSRSPRRFRVDIGSVWPDFTRRSTRFPCCCEAEYAFTSAPSQSLGGECPTYPLVWVSTGLWAGGRPSAGCPPRSRKSMTRVHRRFIFYAGCVSGLMARIGRRVAR
jgi:hypothetical protein